MGTATSVTTTSATINFTQSTWAGKSPSPVYKVVNNANEAQTLGTCTSPCSSIALSGLTSSTSYTVKVRLDTTYGVNSDFSSTVGFTTSAPPPSFSAEPSFSAQPSFPSFPSFPQFTFVPEFTEPCTSCVQSGSFTQQCNPPGGNCFRTVLTYSCAPAGCSGCNCPNVLGSCSGPSC